MLDHDIIFFFGDFSISDNEVNEWFYFFSQEKKRVILFFLKEKNKKESDSISKCISIILEMGFTSCFFSVRLFLEVQNNLTKKL